MSTILLEQYIREALIEAASLPQRFYHGSSRQLKVGTVLGGRAFKSNFGDAEKVLETFRPADMTPRLKAVYMTGRPGDISIAGGETDYIYLLEPLDTPQKHHGGWLGKIYDVLMGEADELTKTGPKLKASTLKKLLPQLEAPATAYWMGQPCRGSGEVWEYLCNNARVIKEV